MKKGKLIALWILAAFFALSAIVFFPSIFSLFAILVVVLVLPIQKWQAFLSRFVKGKLKTVIAVALSLVCVFTAPTTDVEPSQTFNTSTAIVSDFSTEETNDSPSTETTTEPITETITEPDTEEDPDIITEPDSDVDNEEDIESVSETGADSMPESTDEDVPEVPTEAIPEASDTVTEPVHTHNFSPATCTAPGICSCGATDGSANGHSWRDATCSVPQTCAVCGETNGYATGHNYSNGQCIICHSSDPSYVQETYVWIPATGSRYHSHSGCSGMKNPAYVTKSEAVSLGFTPCGKCY